MYLLLTQATFGVLVATMIIGGILPTLAWAGLGGLMADLFGGPIRYSALAIAYAVAAALSGAIPYLTQSLSIATDAAWWHPGVVLAVISLITLASAIAASRMKQHIDPVVLVDCPAAGARHRTLTALKGGRGDHRRARPCITMLVSSGAARPRTRTTGGGES